MAIAGRITAHRDMGKSQFMDLKDVTGRVQIYAQKQTLGDEGYDIFKHLDLADFIGVKGTMFRTRAGEISVKVESFTILAKALRPPYRAIKVTGALFHTQGGLAVDANARVLRRAGTPFPNMFAAGGAAAGVSGGQASGYLSGNGLLTATVLGRLAGAW